MSLMLVMEQKGWGGVFFRQGRNSDSYRCTWQRDRCSNSHRQTKSSFECDREIPQRSAAARSETEPLLGLSCTEPLYIYPDKQANYQRLQLQKTFPHTIKKKKKNTQTQLDLLCHTAWTSSLETNRFPDIHDCSSLRADPYGANHKDPLWSHIFWLKQYSGGGKNPRTKERKSTSNQGKTSLNWSVFICRLIYEVWTVLLQVLHSSSYQEFLLFFIKKTSQFKTTKALSFLTSKQSQDSHFFIFLLRMNHF